MICRFVMNKNYYYLTLMLEFCFLGLSASSVFSLGSLRGEFCLPGSMPGRELVCLQGSLLGCGELTLWESRVVQCGGLCRGFCRAMNVDLWGVCFAMNVELLGVSCAMNVDLLGFCCAINVDLLGVLLCNECGFMGVLLCDKCGFMGGLLCNKCKVTNEGQNA